MSGSPLSAAEKIAGCEDILIQIFLRTPAKSLLKFRSVCKRWLSIISHFSAGELTLAHTQFHRQTPSALLLDDYILPLIPQRDDSLPIFEAPCSDLLNLPWNEVIQSCNGLLLASPTFCSQIDDSDILTGIGYFVCNPTTKEFKKLPPRPEPVQNATIREYALAFDPQKSPHYKVICVRDDNAVEESEIDIYSSETGSWKILDFSFSEPKKWKYSSPVYCNGAVHWYSLAPESIYFNVDLEILDKYPMPECIEEDELDVKYFGESRGRLVLILGKELKFLVFELAKDYSGWAVKYKFRLEPAETAFPEVIGSLEKNLVNVLAVLYEEKEEDSVVVVISGHVIFSCNLISQELKKLSDCDCGSELLRDCNLPWDAVHPYYASFVRV